MRLDITYNTSFLPQKDEATAAFIHSNDPRVWLTELSRCGQSAADWACYAAPQSVQSVAVSGLFVVTEKAEIDSISPHLLWFKRVGDRLFIPTNAKLTPSVSEAELAEILIFDVQFFHPTIGWLGFNRSDKLDLIKLIDFPTQNTTKWHFAHEGLPPRPRLSQIRIQPPQTQNLVEMLQNGLEKKPLKDIPLKDGSKPDAEKSAFDKMMDDVKEQLLRGGRAALDKINDMLPENTTGRESIMDKPYRWLNERLLDLQQKRESEMKRLLDMFENDPDEALKYALPLDDPYQGRGIATPSDTLGPRSTDFNLGHLGGGRAVDGWNSDNYYADLRKKYLDAANKANEDGDYRRAAYIYAHLLGDFSAAANVLEQGGFYREAAALYRDHLKNLAAAANCLEKGKLYLEAIELYQELEQNEKVGDLYELIGQPKNAEFYYEKCVEEVLHTKNFSEIARLENEKLKNPTRAKATLLRGWHAQDFTQSESCLRQYFDLMMCESVENTVTQIEPIFKKSPEQRLSFLSVLVNVNFKYASDDFQKAARPIAYQILSEEAVQGNRSVMQDLAHFFPEDALIDKDISSFLNKKQRKSPVWKPKEKLSFRLSYDSEWCKAFSFPDGFVAIGYSTMMYAEGFYDITQCDWSGKKIENYHDSTYGQELKAFGFARFFGNNEQNKIIVWTFDGGISEFGYSFKTNDKISNELVVESPSWMPSDVLAAGFYKHNRILALRQEFEQVELLFYTEDGALLRKEDCFENRVHFNVNFMYNHPIALLFSQSRCIFYSEKCLFFISTDGEVTRVNIGEFIINIVQSTYATNIFVLITQSGLLIYDSESTQFGDTPPETQFFGPKYDVKDLIFVSSTEIIVLSENEAIGFRQVGNSATPFINIPLERNSVALLRTNEIKQFAVLYDLGMVQYYDWS